MFVELLHICQALVTSSLQVIESSLLFSEDRHRKALLLKVPRPGSGRGILTGAQGINPLAHVLFFQCQLPTLPAAWAEPSRGSIGQKGKTQPAQPATSRPSANVRGVRGQRRAGARCKESGGRFHRIGCPPQHSQLRNRGCSSSEIPPDRGREQWLGGIKQGEKGAHSVPITLEEKGDSCLPSIKAGLGTGLNSSAHWLGEQSRLLPPSGGRN